MSILSLLSALVIGTSLGLLGSGGSIFTIPVLIYLLGRPEKIAIAESLAIVGMISLIGSIPYAYKMQIHWRSLLFFGLPGMLGAWAGACYSFYIKSAFQLSLFTLVVFFVGYLMLFGSSSFEKFIPSQPPSWVIMFQGFFVGCLTGLLGIGGGFLIVPALLILGRLLIAEAVGTSLLIIAMNSLTGFFEHLAILKSMQIEVSWLTIGSISIVGILGCFGGKWISLQFSPLHLRRIFGISIFIMGFFIIFQLSGIKL